MQLQFFEVPTNPANPKHNQILPQDSPIHEWYRFVLSFPPHLVRNYIEKFDLSPGSVVLDPFCGTGTTLVEAQKLGYASIGVEGNPVAHFASQTKVDWSVGPYLLLSHAQGIASKVWDQLECEGIDDHNLTWHGDETCLLRLSPDAEKLLLRDSISPLPLHKTLRLLEMIRKSENSSLRAYEELALAKALYSFIGNLKFGPEVGVGKVKTDAPVVFSWLNNTSMETQVSPWGRWTASMRGLFDYPPDWTPSAFDWHAVDTLVEEFERRTAAEPGAPRAWGSLFRSAMLSLDDPVAFVADPEFGEVQVLFVRLLRQTVAFDQHPDRFGGYADYRRYAMLAHQLRLAVERAFRLMQDPDAPDLEGPDDASSHNDTLLLSPVTRLADTAALLFMVPELSPGVQDATWQRNPGIQRLHQEALRRSEDDASAPWSDDWRDMLAATIAPYYSRVASEHFYVNRALIGILGDLIAFTDSPALFADPGRFDRHVFEWAALYQADAMIQAQVDLPDGLPF